MELSIGFMQGRLSPMVDGKIQSFPWNNWEKEFEIANKNNFRIMEWTLDQHNLNKNPLMTKNGQKKIKILSNKYGISICSLTGDCFMQAPFYKVYGKDQYKLLKNLKSVITACGFMGIKFIIFPLVDNGSLQSKEQEKKLKYGLSFVESLLEKNKVKIVFESDFPPNRLYDFISDFPPEHYGINYDIGNSASLGYNQNYELDILSPWLGSVHVKDRVLGGGTVALGTGNADFPTCFRKIKKAGFFTSVTTLKMKSLFTGI